MPFTQTPSWSRCTPTGSSATGTTTSVVVVGFPRSAARRAPGAGGAAPGLGLGQAPAVAPRSMWPANSEAGTTIVISKNVPGAWQMTTSPSPVVGASPVRPASVRHLAAPEQLPSEPGRWHVVIRVVALVSGHRYGSEVWLAGPMYSWHSHAGKPRSATSQW